MYIIDNHHKYVTLKQTSPLTQSPTLVMKEMNLADYCLSTPHTITEILESYLKLVDKPILPSAESNSTVVLNRALISVYKWAARNALRYLIHKGSLHVGTEMDLGGSIGTILEIDCFSGLIIQREKCSGELKKFTPKKVIKLCLDQRFIEDLIPIHYKAHPIRVKIVS